MATTRLIALHLNKGKTLAACLKERIGYARNGDKTEDEKHVSYYNCSPDTVMQEFMLSKGQYERTHARNYQSDVIAYQIRQSFKPGEITPEEANQVGYETAMSFTKGAHAFIVATHVDKAHIHSHIIFNSTSIDGSRKFRDFKRSGLALQRVSDLICLQHGLSVIRPRISLLVDIQKKMSEGKGAGYERWAKKFNLKQMAETLIFLREKGIESYEELVSITDKKTEDYHELAASIRKYEARIDEIGALRKNIRDFARTRKVYEAYRESRFDNGFYESHREELTIYDAARKALDAAGIHKFPKISDLNREFDDLVRAKRAAYAQYREVKEDMKELQLARRNVEEFLSISRKTQRKERDYGRGNQRSKGTETQKHEGTDTVREGKGNH